MFKYPWGNLQGLNLAWFLEKFNQLLEDWATAEAGIDGALDDEIQKAEDALSDVYDARDAAAASATAAAGSATQAGTSATAAQNSATAAASSATLANNKATAAGLSEANAAQSASQAAGSATAAAGSATAAGNSATAAANSATAAGQEATNAADSATAAAGSASDAAGSATAAAASAAAAEAVEESIPEDYTALSNDVTDLKAALTYIRPERSNGLFYYPNYADIGNENTKILIAHNMIEIEQLTSTFNNLAKSLLTGETVPTTITETVFLNLAIQLPDYTVMQGVADILESNIEDSAETTVIRLYYYNNNNNLTFANIPLTRKAGTKVLRNISDARATNIFVLPVLFRTGTAFAMGKRIRARYYIVTANTSIHGAITANKFFEIGDILFKSNVNIAANTPFSIPSEAQITTISAALNSLSN